MELKFETLEIRKIGNEEINSVLASELYEQLEIKKDFTNWMKAQIKRGMFEESFDFVVVWSYAQKGGSSKIDKLVSEGLPKGEKSKQAAFANGWSYDYILSPDTAKEIAMMSQTQKGKEIRKYFINVEKVAKKMLGEKKLELEIKKLETEEKLLHESIIDKRVERVKKLQELGCNFDPISIINPELLTGSKINKDTAEALTDAYSDIRPNIRAYSATYLLKKFNVGILTPEWNNYLIELGYMESYIYNERRYKKFVKDVNYYGYNKHFSSVKKDPMQPYYYEDRFMDLVTLLRNEGYID
jgi:phage anti-repressor protein